MRLLVTMALMVCLGGCIGPNPNLGVVNVAMAPPDRAGAAQLLAVVDTAPAGAVAIGPVEATSCKNKAWDPRASEENALAQLRMKALDVGATSLVGVSYSKGGFSMVTNCWESITATATAYR